MADGRGDKLLCVWTSGDRDVALRMVFMYVSNGKKNGWWDEVTLLVWGPSQKLLAEDDVLKGRLAEMLALGVRVVACRACADTYSLADTLEGLGGGGILHGEVPEPLGPVRSSCSHFLDRRPGEA